MSADKSLVVILLLIDGAGCLLQQGFVAVGICSNIYMALLAMTSKIQVGRK